MENINIDNDKQNTETSTVENTNNEKEFLEQFDSLTMDEFLLYAFRVISNCDMMLINILKTGKYPKLPKILAKMLTNTITKEDLADIPSYSPIYSDLSSALQVDKVLKSKGVDDLFYNNIAFPNYADCTMVQYIDIKQRIASIILMAQNNILDSDKVEMCNIFLTDAFGYCYMPYVIFAKNVYGTLGNYEDDDEDEDEKEEFDFPFNGFQA